MSSSRIERATAPAGLRRRTLLIDSAVVVGLVALAAYLRRDVLPSDGLWLDDAWVAVAARAPFSDLLSVSWNHPGFTFFEQVVNSVGPDRVELLARPVLVAGVLGVPLLYLALRALGFAPLAAAPVGVVVALNRTHVTYSGRVKPYVFEVTGIALLAVAVHVLGARRWRWKHAVAWLALALAVSTVSAFGFAAAAVAMVVLALHPAGDRRVRLTVLAVQGAVQLTSGLLTRSRYDTAEVAALWETHYDAYIDLTEGPLGVLRQLGRHTARLAETWIDLPGPLPVLVLLAGLGGLGWACVRGDRTTVARFLAVLPVLAVVGSMVEQVPFGPTPDRSVFPGSRGSMWLYPSLGFGLAAALQAVLDAAARVQRPAGASPPSRRVAAVVAAIVVATAAVVVAGIDLRSTYGVLGNASATAHIEAERRPGDVVFFFEHARYIVASEPPVPFRIRWEPDRIEGFTPVLGGGRVAIPPRPELTRQRVAELVGDADRVFVHNSFIGFGDADGERLAALLADLGFERERSDDFHINRVEVWAR